jgi:hypothetical protein
MNRRKRQERCWKAPFRVISGSWEGPNSLSEDTDFSWTGEVGVSVMTADNMWILGPSILTGSETTEEVPP